MTSAPSSISGFLLHLQKHYGNRSVQRLLNLARREGGEREVTSEVESVSQGQRASGQTLDDGSRINLESSLALGSTTPSRFVHRQCACGGETTSGAQCESCGKKREAVTQSGTVRRLRAVAAHQPSTLVARQVAEEEGEYTPAEEGGYTPAEEGGYTPAEEGGYTPAEEGGYTPAEEGGYTPAEEGGDVDQWPESQQSDGGGAGGAPPGTITNLPGTDYDSCVEQTEEDTARLVDTINTACSVKGAAFAVGGGAAGAFLGPIGAGIGAVAGGIYGAYNYGKCVEEQNAMARAGAKKQKAQCAEKFKH